MKDAAKIADVNQTNRDALLLLVRTCEATNAVASAVALPDILRTDIPMEEIQKAYSFAQRTAWTLSSSKMAKAEKQLYL